MNGEMAGVISRGSRPAARRIPGAVVIGGDYQGLAIARSLGRRGVPVVILDDERAIGRYSRFVERFVRVPQLRTEEATVGALLELARRHGLRGWVIFPTREETVCALARNRERLLDIYRVPTPPWDTVRWAWDKRNTYRLAAELGVATPRSWSLRGEDDLSAVDGGPPYVVKPAIKERFLYATGRKAWRADSREQLEQLVRAAAGIIGAGEVIVQELIPGGGEAQFSFCAFFKDGRARASMTAQRLRQHPMDFGRASTYVRTVAERGLAEPSERLLRAISYYGLAELEFKRDPRDGIPKLLDFNPRTWGYHSLAQRAGVDFPYHLYADQLGLAPPDDGRAQPGVGWVRLATDVPTAALELASGRLRPGSYLRSLLGARVEAVFSREDLLPGLAELALLPYTAVKRGL